ncbi:MAG: hypothetical protein ACYCSP_00945 [Acidobacteriaceae bacterium]
MVLKSYFDGANKADSTQYDVVTLASVSGTKYEWRPFEREWRQVLKKHKAPYLHVTDTIAFRDAFKDGWNERRRDAFILDCVRLIGRHIARPISGSDRGRQGLLPHTITIDLKDFIRARKVNPDVPKSANEICVTQAVFDCMKWGLDVLGVEHFHLFFDRNEQFRGHICDRVNNPKVLKKLPFLAKITTIAEVDMRNAPALQFADLLGWCASHKQDVRTKWHERMLKNSWTEYIVGYDQLINPIPRAVEFAKEWKLPRRRLHP